MTPQEQQQAARNDAMRNGTPIPVNTIPAVDGVVRPVINPSTGLPFNQNTVNPNNPNYNTANPNYLNNPVNPGYPVTNQNDPRYNPNVNPNDPRYNHGTPNYNPALNCPGCGGTGLVDGNLCKTCKGTGKVK